MEKPQLGLIPPDFDEEEAMAWASGNHGERRPHDWRERATREKVEHAILRHLNAWRRGDTHDSISGAHHLAHVICNAKMLMWCERRDVAKQERAARGTARNN